ncbi:MAG: sulfotransferase [Flavobacteriaceae bacterium]|nr:sulfotransferase [Flavobacteriaceae bacterium]
MTGTNSIDFFLVGAARCGTTSLYENLNLHPQIFLPPVKEPNYFSDVESPRFDDYEPPEDGKPYHTKIINSSEVYDGLYKGALPNQLKGDTSPSYLWDLNSAKRIFEHNPKARILISLRNPAQRAFSHYIMNYFTGSDESSSFEKALKAPENPMWGGCNLYLDMSRYYHQVKEYYDLFPKEQIMIILYEDYISDIEGEMERIYKFLGIDHSDLMIETDRKNEIKTIKNLKLLNLFRKNWLRKPLSRLISQERIEAIKRRFFESDKPKDSLSKEMEHELMKEFQDDVLQLSNLIGLDLNKKWN